MLIGRDRSNTEKEAGPGCLMEPDQKEGNFPSTVVTYEGHAKRIQDKIFEQQRSRPLSMKVKDHPSSSVISIRGVRFLAMD